MIRQGDLARNFASQICCENAGILCVFQGFRSGFVGEKNRQRPQTQLCGVAFNFTAFYRKRPMPIFAVGYINYGIQGEGPAGGRIIWFDGSHDPTPDRGPISVPTEMGERAAQGAFVVTSSASFVSALRAKSAVAPLLLLSPANPLTLGFAGAPVFRDPRGNVLL